MVASEHIVVRNLGKVFTTAKGQRHVQALVNVNLQVREGRFFSVLGPSGCGKSTLLRVIGGLLEPTQGTVSMGNGVTPRAAQRAKEIGFVFQDPGLLPWKTVTQNIQLALQINKKANRPGDHSIEDLIDLVGLAEFCDALPHQLSGGMQQRVAIARALAIYPKTLLMDEPFGALDLITRQAMRYELLRIWEQAKKTVVFVTHSIDEAIVLSDAVAVMSSGPGTILGIVDIDLPRPRTEEMERTEAFLSHVNRLKRLLRGETEDATNSRIGQQA